MYFKHIGVAMLLISSMCLFSPIKHATAQPTTSSSQNCACPDKGEPVCANGKQFKNSCFADCAGVTSHSPCSQQQQQQTAAGAAPKPQLSPKPSGSTNTAQTGDTSGGAAPACACPREFNPVCGVDGAFFPNKCLAKCVGTQVSDKPPKDGKCSFIKEQQQQQQQQQKQKPASPAPASAAPSGSSSKDCGCPNEVTVVCGTLNGKESNYANPCTANCLGAQVLYNTPCKRDSSSSGSGASAPAAAAPQQQQQQQQVAAGNVQTGAAVSQPQLQSEPTQLPPLEYYMEPAAKCGCPRLKLRACAMVYRDYVTVINSCTARCYGLPIAHLGKCHDHDLARNQLYIGDLDDKHREHDQKGGCVCPMIYSPVCANGLTFSNACVARCNGYPLALATNCILGL